MIADSRSIARRTRLLRSGAAAASTRLPPEGPVFPLRVTMRNVGWIRVADRLAGYAGLLQGIGEGRRFELEGYMVDAKGFVKEFGGVDQDAVAVFILYDDGMAAH